MVDILGIELFCFKRILKKWTWMKFVMWLERFEKAVCACAVAVVLRI